MRKTKQEKGITLVALIVTIIILLILAGISIAGLTQRGIFEQTQTAKKEYTSSQALEELKLKIYQVQVEKEGKATLEDFVEFLDRDTENLYEIELEQTATIVGEIPDLVNKNNIILKYKNFKFLIDLNLNIQYIGDEETGKNISYSIFANMDEGIGMSNTVTEVQKYAEYETTLFSEDENYELKSILVKMKGEDLTNDGKNIIDIQTGRIYIQNVIGNIEIIATKQRKIVPVEGITLNKTSLDLRGGETYTLIATVTPQNADNKIVIWTSENNNIATVENGVVQTKNVTGTTKIVATSEENNQIKAECVINVKSGVLGQYFILDVFDNWGGNGASIGELQIYNANGTKLSYTTHTDIASSNSWWGCGNDFWGVDNLQDGNIAYSTNTIGRGNCTFFAEATGGQRQRVLISLSSAQYIGNVRIAVGDNEGRTPKRVSLYKVNSYTSNTKATNIVNKSNTGLTLVKTKTFNTVVNTPTWYYMN